MTVSSIRILDIIHDTTVDGPGFRTSIYCAGCRHACPGCHNPESWNPRGGHDENIDALMAEIVSDPFANVTFSGGDPMFQAEGFLELCRRIRSETDKTVWCFTGFTWERILEEGSPAMRELAGSVDVLVDGPFVQSLRDTDLHFRGSSNQRLIDVASTIREGRVVLWERK